MSRKETRWQPDGPVEMLIDNIFDLYPVFGQGDAPNLITDIEILNDDREELLDRAMFVLVKQRGQNPVEPDDDIQWSEALVGEVPASMIIQQVHASVSEEGPGVRVVPSTIKNNGKENLMFKIELTNAV